MTLYTDPFFPADLCSIVFDPEAPKPDFAKAVHTWRRPREWAPTAQILVDSSNPGDIEQGSLGDCWFLSALTVVASYPLLIKKLFVETDTKQGKYKIRLYLNSVWNEVTIDDRIPCGPNGLPCFGHNIQKNETWIVLIEKAVAKLLGGYEALNGGYMEEGIVMLTGARPDRLHTNNWQEEIGKVVLKKEKLWEKIEQYSSQNVMMGCSISNGKEERNETKGLVAGHAYAILDVRETQDKKYSLIKLRNPWACFEWKGDWSDNSKKWTFQYKKELNFKAGDDGIMWMAFNDFISIFDTICVARLFNDFLMTSAHTHFLPISNEETQLEFPDTHWNGMKFEGAWNETNCGGLITSKPAYSKNPHLSLSIMKPGRYFIHMNREGLDPNVEAQYYRTAIGFVIHLGNDNKYLEPPNEMTAETYIQYPSFSRFNSVELELEPGTYVITACTMYPNQKSKFWVEVYGEYPFNCESMSDSVAAVRAVPGSARNIKAKNHELFKDSAVPPQLANSFTLSKPPVISPELQNNNNNTLMGGTKSFVFNAKTLSASERIATPKFMTSYMYEYGKKKL